MSNFWKGIVIGLGAVAPGLSGSILLVIFGLYQNAISAISNILRDFRRSVRFLFPIGCGVLLGIVLFSKLVDFLLIHFEMPTRFAFLGFILGSVPLFYRQVKQQGFGKKYYFIIGAAFLTGILLFGINPALFPEVAEPTLPQAVLLGFVVAASYVVPGVDSAAILSALGLYDLWVHSLATLDFAVLLPAAVGMVLGVLGVSILIKLLMVKWYTVTFSVIFGLFLSVIPSVLNESCVIGLNWDTLLSVLLLAAGFVLSLLFGRLERRSSQDT